MDSSAPSHSADEWNIALQNSRYFGNKTGRKEEGRVFWSDRFWRHFGDLVLSSVGGDDGNDSDDMLFFVNEPGVDREEGFTDVGSDTYFVRRRGAQSSSFPRLSPTVDWEASYFLNALCNRLNFILIITSRTAAGAIHSKESRRIYASPHAVQMEIAGGKSEETSHSFPTVSFQLHDHWGHTTITADQGSTLGVELAVKGDLLGKSVKCYVFRGALPFSKIAEEYSRVSASKWVWARADEHMVKMRGPGGRGEAIMAVKRESTAGPNVPPASTLSALRSWIPFGGGASAASNPNSLSYVCVVSSISLDWREIVERITKESEK